MKDERQRFLEEEWPKIYATIQRLGLTQDELQRAAAAAPAVPWPAANSASPGSGSRPGEDDDSSN